MAEISNASARGQIITSYCTAALATDLNTTGPNSPDFTSGSFFFQSRHVVKE
jgi:hypothetical protein